MQVSVILAAAGKSSRFGQPTDKKVFCEVYGRPLWIYSAEKFRRSERVKQMILVISSTDKEFVQKKYADDIERLQIEVVVGGAERADSVWKGLCAIQQGITHVAVHDAARPCVETSSIEQVFDVAAEFGAAILATPCNATLKKTNEHQLIEETIPRQGVWLAQTPQVFKTQTLVEAYQQSNDPSSATDEASLVEAAGGAVQVVPGPATNMKVTTLEDLEFVRFMLSGKS